MLGYGTKAIEIADILDKPTALTASTAEMFKYRGEGVREFCEHGNTREECNQTRGSDASWCPKLHFRRMILPHTEVSLGDCSFLSTCRRLNVCRYIHYEIEGDGLTGLSSQIQYSSSSTRTPFGLGMSISPRTDSLLSAFKEVTNPVRGVSPPPR